MVKFRLFPQWKYKQVELWLAEMEQSGFRLSEVVCFWFFVFVKAKPRNTRYLFLYEVNREIAMYDCELELKKNGANQIQTDDITSTLIYRITNPDYDISDIVSFRQNYMKRVFKKKMLYSVIMMVPPLAGFILGRDMIATTSTFNLVFLTLLLVAGVYYFCWNLYGLIYTKRNCG